MEKEDIRRYVWDLLVKKGVARFPFPVEGRIPNFKGAEVAALNLSRTPEWRLSSVIFVNPDSPQRFVRHLALMQGKVVIMSTPRLRRGFLLLDPSRIMPRNYWEASSIRGAFKHGTEIGLNVPRVDLKVTGSVAVDESGNRIGKGHGYSDLEYGILGEIGAITEETPVATTVHDLQVLKEVPSEEHDMPVSLIVTPTRIIRTGRKGSPKIFWEKIGEELLKEIPLLSELKP